MGRSVICFCVFVVGLGLVSDVCFFHHRGYGDNTERHRGVCVSSSVLLCSSLDLFVSDVYFFTTEGMEITRRGTEEEGRKIFRPYISNSNDFFLYP